MSRMRNFIDLFSKDFIFVSLFIYLFFERGGVGVGGGGNGGTERECQADPVLKAGTFPIHFSKSPSTGLEPVNMSS